MQDLKISIITVCYNASETIEKCIQSVINQDYAHIEYIVTDGCSTDGTNEIIRKYTAHVDAWVTEPDQGIYDAMNKGIALATGDIVGMLNADDVFTQNGVVSTIVAAFETHQPQILYADLHYLKPNGNIFRKWKSGRYKEGKFNKGWMPPHPTFYCRRNLYQHYGGYSLAFGTAADYELMLRFIHLRKAPVFYLEKVIVHMNRGGVSNNSYTGRLKVLFWDWKAMKKNGLRYPFVALLYKRLIKIGQLVGH